MKTVFFAIGIALLLTLNACATFQNSLISTGASLMADNFVVTMFSGGQPVKSWSLHGMVDDDASGSGWVFTCKGHLVRLSGNVVVEPTTTATSATTIPTTQCN